MGTTTTNRTVTLGAGQTLIVSGSGQIERIDNAYTPATFVQTLRSDASKYGPYDTVTQWRILPAGTAKFSVSGDTGAGNGLVAVFGDSLGAQSILNGALVNDYGYQAAGFMTWLIALSMGALACPMVVTAGVAGATVQYNRSVSGETAEQAVARLRSEMPALPVKPQYVVIFAGTNNLTLNPSQTAEELANVLIGGCEWALSVGVTPLLYTIPARGVWAGLDAGQIVVARNKWLAANRMLRSYARMQRKMKLADAAFVNVDQSSATSNPLVEHHPDSLHTSASGAIRIGDVGWQALKSDVNLPFNLEAGQADLYSAANPYGSLLDSSWSAGGGTAGDGTSGTIPNGWTAARFEGAAGTLVMARQARSDGLPGNEVQMTFAGVTGPAAFRIYQGDSQQNAANYADGDVVYGVCDVDFAGATAPQALNPDITIWLSSGTGFVYAARNETSGAIRGNYKFRLTTPLVVLASGQKPSNAWTLDRTVAGSATVVKRQNFDIFKYDRGAFGALDW